uniref:Uncharacterized protein n=1 Tax=Bellilinea caldifistulae TaxID=360411 RepID=A0A7C4Q9P6_9CHLR
MIKKPFFFILLGVLLIGLLSAAGCGGGVISAPPANRTETPLPSPTPTPTPTLLPGPAATPTAQISPTQPCSNLELELDYQQVQQAEGLYALLTARGSIPLTVQFQQSPPRVEGFGQAEVGGNGHAENCSWIYTGLLEYDLHGDLLLDRQPPILRLSGKRGARNLAAIGTECWGGQLSPVISDDIPLFEIEYRDTATLKYSYDMPTLHAEAVWTLHFRCP